MDVDTTSQRLQTSDILNNVYATSVILEGLLSLAEMQADGIGNNYGKLMENYNPILIIFKIF